MLNPVGISTNACDHVQPAFSWPTENDRCPSIVSMKTSVRLRSIIALSIMLAIAPRFGGLRSLRTREPGWHAVRSVLAIGAMIIISSGVFVVYRGEARKAKV